MLDKDNVILLVIDVQEKLFRVMAEKETLAANLLKLVRGCRIMGVPVMVTEQNPTGIGPTLPDLKAALTGSPIFAKHAFSCCAEDEFMQMLRSFGRRQVIIAGLEAHICVHQTAAGLLQLGYNVHMATDCVSSRSPENKNLALRRLEQDGAKLTGVEMALFEMLKTSACSEFEAISTLIK